MHTGISQAELVKPIDTPLVQIEHVLIVEDQIALQERMLHLAQQAYALCSVTCVGTLTEAKHWLDQMHCDVVLVDLGLPDGNGTDLVAWMSKFYPDIASVVVTAERDLEKAMDGLRAGAVGFLYKDREDYELLGALQSLQNGGAPIDPLVARKMLGLFSSTPDSAAQNTAKYVQEESNLTPRELELLKFIAQGLTNLEIATDMALSVNTVEWYSKKIYRKLHVRNRMAAVVAAREQGWLTLDAGG
jgi:DNA-binding NarL/FixJ family response regulator